MHVIKILLIDDDPLILATYDAAFTDAGFIVRTAEDASDGFAILQVYRPDVVILDLNMPGAGGLAWLRAARQLPEFATVPVVIVTGAALDSPEVRAAHAEQVQGVLQKKSWTPDELISAAHWAATHPGLSWLERAA